MFHPPSDNAVSVAPSLMDPRNPSTLYSGQTHLWRTDNSARTWRTIRPAGGTSGITAAAVAPTSPGTVYIGDWNNDTNDGDVWMTQTATSSSPTWQEFTHTLPGPVTGLSVGPGTPNTIYVSLNNFNNGPGGFVYKGTVTGQVPHARVQWTNITKNLPSITYYSIAVDQSRPTTLYVGGYNGAFVSTDGRVVWKQLGSTLPAAQVFQLVQAHRRLYAFTYGRGAYSIRLPVS